MTEARYTPEIVEVDVERRGGFVAVEDWAGVADEALLAARAARAAEIRALNARLERIKAGAAQANPARVDGFKARVDVLNRELAAIRKEQRARLVAPAAADAGRPLAAMTGEQLVAYADELDEEIREVKVDLAEVQRLRALAIGELGRRKIAWKAKH